MRGKEQERERKRLHTRYVNPYVIADKTVGFVIKSRCNAKLTACCSVCFISVITISAR